MSKQIKIIYAILLFIVATRVFSMITLPLTDTTEARYAHTAYLMALSNDWITPYFDLNIPFWGKPPFSFWMEALSYKLFGIHDFAPRIPALLFTLMTMLLIVNYLKTFYTKQTAWWGGLIYMSFLLTYVLSGAVLTDPYLVFSTTLAMISFLMIVKKRESYWQYLFFIAVSIGLLAKGPLALVLIGGAIVFWILFNFKKRILVLKELYWVRGSLLTVLLVLPWYLMAEMKTPGFLNYFIIGEHFKRFVDPGWSGDLYGVSHKKPHGIIWLMWIEASFPWVFLVFYALYQFLKSKTLFFQSIKVLKENEEISYFIMWSLFTMTFFSFAGNTLWTYILPALPALAILLALYLEKKEYEFIFKNINILYLLSLIVPTLLLISNIYLVNNPNVLPTEKYLIHTYYKLKTENSNLYYFMQRAFSAQYYSNNQAIYVTDKKEHRPSNSINSYTFLNRLKRDKNIFIAVPKENVKTIKKFIKKPLSKLFESNNYILFKVET